ncbi:MAG: fructose-1,6-bisphosphatase [Paludibacteraceae bacterium]|nr:fructose-1,6-bisphosphatase [Bacteroidales bacterium]MDY4149071.1 fructose-1,6-bisphosphatase [Paludibacteraceae bacterium]
MDIEEIKGDLRYLKLLSEKFPNNKAVITELINLRAILSLPKGTEHFVSDLHGESSAFIHTIKNASGVIRHKIDDLFGDQMSETEKRALCALIYYPDERIELVQQSLYEPIEGLDEGIGEFAIEDWYRIRLHQVVLVARAVTIKYSRSKVRKLLPKDYAYIIDELLHESNIESDRAVYYNAIIDTIIDLGCAEKLITAISYLIHSFTIDTLHVVGDIFDRGSGASKIIDVLSTLRDYDIQWGNHDIEWMGAMAGNLALIATVLRVSIRYANIETLEEGYGINLLPLANFAMETYGDDPCRVFQTKDFENNPRLTRSAALMAKMHKAISIIQFKLEGQTILRHPEWGMNDRLLLDKIDLQYGTIRIGGQDYALTDRHLPTLSEADPYRLSAEEEELMAQLERSFRNSEKMQKHLHLLYQHGSMFLVRNGFLLYHAAVPLNSDGSFTEVDVCGKRVSGRALMERTDEVVRTAYYGAGKEKANALDYMLYLWEGPCSPLYNKDKMTTLERYFVDDERTWKEQKGAYYTLANERETCEMILREFGMDEHTGRIINGHIPVRTIAGETPIRAEGKRFVIDGGFSKPYQEKTGIAGYTLIYNSHGIQLVEHESFESREQAILSGSDIHSRTLLQDFTEHRLHICDTDRGRELQAQVTNLEHLLEAYQIGLIK